MSPAACWRPTGRKTKSHEGGSAHWLQGCGSPVGYGLPSIVGAGFIPPAGVCAAAGVRRDEGIPPYGRPGGCGRSGLAGCVRKACRGGIYPSRKPCRSPHTHGRAAALLYEPVQIPPSGWPQTQNLFVGAGFIPPAGVCAAAGCGGMRASRPTDARVVAAVRFGRSFRKVCRGGIYPARGCLRRRGSAGRCEHRPLQGFVVTGGRGFPVGRGIRRRP